MADFVSLTRNDNWIIKPGPQTVQPIVEHLTYLNDGARLGDHVEDVATPVAVESLAPTATKVSEPAKQVKLAKQGGTFVSSLLWPKTAWEDRDAWPFVSAGIVGLVISPIFANYMWQGALPVTAHLVSGYTAGIVLRYVTVQKVVKDEPLTPVEAFIREREVRENETIRTTSQPPPQADSQPTLQQQIWGLQGAD